MALRGKREQKKSWRDLAFLIFLGMFLLSGGLLLRDFRRAGREEAANQSLAQQIHAAEEVPQDSENVHPEPQEDPKWEQYRLLREQNQDFAGWLSIQGSKIDYPVMYTPEEPEYYLRRAFDGSYAVSGSLFLGAGCTPEGSHRIIYGHHMNNGTMFGSLQEYQDPAYWAEHREICFDTLESEGKYEVLAAFYSRIYKVSEEDVFRYYQYADLSDPERFDEYVEQVRAAALYDTGITAEYGDRLLTLSTCSYHTKNGRFVVVAVERPEEVKHKSIPEA